MTVHAKLVIVLMEIVHLVNLDLDLITSLFNVLPAILHLSQKELLPVLTAITLVQLVVKLTDHVWPVTQVFSPT